MSIKVEYTPEAKVEIIQQYIVANMNPDDFRDEIADTICMLANPDIQGPIRAMSYAYGIVLVKQFSEDINKVVDIINKQQIVNTLFDKLLVTGEVDKITNNAECIYLDIDPITGETKHATIH